MYDGVSACGYSTHSGVMSTQVRGGGGRGGGGRGGGGRGGGGRGGEGVFSVNN